MKSLQNYLSTHPEQANAPLNITVAQAGVLFDALSAARGAALEGNNQAGRKKQARDSAEKALRKRWLGKLTKLNSD